MQVILKKDVQNLGEVGDLINVKDGYARNYLIPNNLAQVATKGALADNKIFKELNQKLKNYIMKLLKKPAKWKPLKASKLILKQVKAENYSAQLQLRDWLKKFLQKQALKLTENL